MPFGVSRSRVSGIIAATATVLLIVGALTALSVSSTSSEVLGSAPSSASAGGGVQSADPTAPSWPSVGSTDSPIKNVVLLLADDLDSTLFDQVPRLAALKQQGTYLSNFVVTDSLCCPSRASIMRSQYVHNHRVLSNVIQTGGGFEKFYLLREQNDCLPTWLKAAGVQTALVGKYLNGYPKTAPVRTYIPPGWDHFVTSVSGKETYSGFDYILNRNGTLERHGSGPGDFVNDVLTTDATDWLSTTTSPFFLEFASYSPHSPFPVAEQNRARHAGALAPTPPSFNARAPNEPPWLAAVKKIGPKRVTQLNTLWSLRLESAESVADSYDAIVAQLEASGHLADTLIIVTSDNGYHVGVHRLDTGKQTPYREDTIVPAVLIGPGVPQGATISRMTSTIDLAPTIGKIMGASTPDWVDGRDLVPLIQDPQVADWRDAVLTENLAGTRPGDPDYTVSQPPFFSAMRSEQWMYVEYGRKDFALYDLVADPYEIRNIVGSVPKATLVALHEQLLALQACAGPECRVADAMRIVAPTPVPAASPTATPSASPA